MAVPASAVDRTVLGNKTREDYGDVIYNISPLDTPFVMKIGSTSADQDVHEWTTDALAAARSDNRHVDGDDFIAEGASGQVGSGFIGVAATAGSRIGNHSQISRKDIVTTRRAQLVKKAGRKDELGYQIAKAGRELKRDCETALLANNIAVQGSTTVAGQTASYLNWMRANTNRRTAATAGADPAALVNGFPTGAAALDSTATRPMSEQDLLTVLGSCYIAGGDIDLVLMHPTVKQKWSQYMFSPSTTDSGRIATQYQEQGKSPSKGATALGAVDVYVSDFGVIDIMPDRFMRTRDVLVMETDMWAVAYLDRYAMIDIAATGPSSKRMLNVDFSLEARNPESSGIVADVSNTAAMVFATSQAT